MLGDNCPKCGYPLVGGTCANMCEDFPERSNLRQQLAIAERQLEIVTDALREYADENNWDGSRLPEWHRYPEPVYERGQQALSDMENVKHGS